MAKAYFKPRKAMSLQVRGHHGQMYMFNKDKPLAIELELDIGMMKRRIDLIQVDNNGREVVSYLNDPSNRNFQSAANKPLSYVKNNPNAAGGFSENPLSDTTKGGVMPTKAPEGTISPTELAKQEEEVDENAETKALDEGNDQNAEDVLEEIAEDVSEEIVEETSEEISEETLEESDEPVEEAPNIDWKKAELVAYASEKGIAVNAKGKKEEVLKAIQATEAE